MAKKQPDERKDRYFQVHHYMMKTDAWRALSAAARAVYLQIGLRYDGFNNGKIAYSVRDAAAECDMNKDTAGRAFKELAARGFIEETRHGGLSRKTRVASEWRLTAFKCDLTGALKTCAFMHRGGPEFSSHTPLKGGRLPGKTYPLPVRNKRRECPKIGDSLSETKHPETADCPKIGDTQADFGPEPVRKQGTHIVYQSVVSSDEATQAPADDALTPPPAPPSPLVLWAAFSPSAPRQPASVVAAAPRNPDPAAIVEPIDGVYLIGGRRVEVLDRTQRNAARRADFHDRPAQRTALPSNALHADYAQQTVDISTPNSSSLIH
jgi:hypothetical protein